MDFRFWIRLVSAACLALAASAGTALAGPMIAFEWTPGTNSQAVSFHNITGPVLADDFTPAVGGHVSRVDWWGSAPLVAGAPDFWEITFHTDNGGVPAFTLPSGGISQHFVTSGGTDPDGDGVFFYSASWMPQDVLLTAGADYWFSVANASGNGWTWANPGAGPTVGSQQYLAALSLGGNPSQIAGPHDGPWTTMDQNFAFRIWVDVPEPPVLALFGLGLVGLGLMRRRKAA